LLGLVIIELRIKCAGFFQNFADNVHMAKLNMYMKFYLQH